MIKYYKFTNPVTNEITKFELTIDDLTPEDESAIEEFLELTKRDIALHPEFFTMIEEGYQGLLSWYFEENLINILDKDLKTKEMLYVPTDNLNDTIINLPRNDTNKKYRSIDDVPNPKLRDGFKKVTNLMNYFAEFGDDQLTLADMIVYWNVQKENEVCRNSWFLPNKYNNEKTLARPDIMLNVLKGSKDDVNTIFSDSDIYDEYQETLDKINDQIY